VAGCLFHLYLCGPVMDCRPVQGVPLPNDSWDRQQHPHYPGLVLSGYRKWIDATWMEFLQQGQSLI